MSTEIMKKESVATIVAIAPKAFDDNKSSHEQCTKFGFQLLANIKEAEEMTDELDQQAAVYIDRSRQTVKKMLEQRAPVTKLFDEIRTVFTSMENDVDPTKAQSPASQLQRIRNDYAAKKRAEAEAKRREEERLQRIEAAKIKYKSEVETNFRDAFQKCLNYSFNQLTMLNQAITLVNYDESYNLTKGFSIDLSDEYLRKIFNTVTLRPAELTSQMIEDISNEVKSQLTGQFKEQYNFEIATNRDSILELLPSKKKELEEIAKSGAEEAARRKAELEQREAEEARKREEDRSRKETEDKQKAELQKQQSEMSSLFSASAAAAPVYQPKTAVKKKIVINDQRGFLDIMNLWWVNEGAKLSVEDLQKKFKSQVTFCEKLANDKSDPKTIQSQYIEYVDEVKAK